MPGSVASCGAVSGKPSHQDSLCCLLGASVSAAPGPRSGNRVEGPGEGAAGWRLPRRRGSPGAAPAAPSWARGLPMACAAAFRKGHRQALSVPCATQAPGRAASDGLPSNLTQQRLRPLSAGLPPARVPAPGLLVTGLLLSLGRHPRLWVTGGILSRSLTPEHHILMQK